MDLRKFSEKELARGNFIFVCQSARILEEQTPDMGSTEGFLRPLVGKPARMGRRAVTVNEGTRAWRHTPLAAHYPTHHRRGPPPCWVSGDGQGKPPVKSRVTARIDRDRSTGLRHDNQRRRWCLSVPRGPGGLKATLSQTYIYPPSPTLPSKAGVTGLRY